MNLFFSSFLSSIILLLCFSMVDSIADHEDLLEQRYANINLQIQCVKQEQNRVSHNKKLHNICQQRLDKLRKMSENLHQVCCEFTLIPRLTVYFH